MLSTTMTDRRGMRGVLARSGFAVDCLEHFLSGQLLDYNLSTR